VLLCCLASAAETDSTLFPSQPEPKAAAAEPNAAQPAQTDDAAAPTDEQAQSESGTPDKKTEEIPSKAGKTRGAKRPAEEAAPAAKKVKA
jgi:hypothetical protein